MTEEDFVIKKHWYEFRGSRKSDSGMGVTIYEGQFYRDDLPFGDLVRLIVDLVEINWYAKLHQEINRALIKELDELAFEGDAY